MTLYEEISDAAQEYIPEGKIEQVFEKRDKEGNLDIKTFWKIIIILIRRVNDLEKRTR